MKITWITAVLLILLCLTSKAASYQQGVPPQDDKEETAIKIGTDLLQIDVVVTDKKGRPIDNLTAQDFELIEDGKPQQFAFFSAIKELESSFSDKQSEAAVPPPAASTLPSPQSQVYILFVDDLHISSQNINNVKKLLKNFTAQQVRDGDRVAIVTSSGALGILQQLTVERRINNSAIERLSSQQRRAVP